MTVHRHGGQLRVIQRCQGVDVAARMGVDVHVVYVARHEILRMIRETINCMEVEDTDGFFRQPGAGGVPETRPAVRNRPR